MRAVYRRHHPAALLAYSAVGSAKLPVRLAPPHHFLAVAIECIVDDGFSRDQFMVVLEAEMPEAFGNRVQPGGLRLVPKRVIGVGAVDDFGHKNDGRIARETVLLHQSVEGAL